MQSFQDAGGQPGLRASQRPMAMPSCHVTRANQVPSMCHLSLNMPWVSLLVVILGAWCVASWGFSASCVELSICKLEVDTKVQRYQELEKERLGFHNQCCTLCPLKSLVNSLYCKWAAKVVYRKPFSKAMVSEFPSCCSMRQSEHRFPLQQCLHQLLGYGCSCLDVGQRLDMDSCCTELGIKTINVCWTTSQLKEVRTFFCLSLSQGHSLDNCSATSSFICNSAKLHFQWATCLQWL